jgi:S-adenosylmethionine synthetase
VNRIAGETIALDYHEAAQDPILAKNQERELRCGDNGIFRGVPVTEEQMQLVAMAKALYEKYPYDGKFIMDGKRLIICQSNAEAEDIQEIWPEAEVNPLGYWTGGTDVDTGATNRKLGSDMADSVTGGGLHGKDLSKADVAVNIYAWLKAQQAQVPVQFSCAIGDRMIDGIPYANVVQIAKHFIDWIGGFEKFAEWGLV